MTRHALITGARLPFYFDIDGTLTTVPNQKWGAPIRERIAQVVHLIGSGQEVIIWSGGGTSYAREFADRHGIHGALCVGKPHIIIDDNPHIRPRTRMQIISPGEWFDK